MYTKEQYEKRIIELKPIAYDFANKKTPDETREIISGMSPEDAYILGMWLGKILALDELGRNISGMVVKIVEMRLPDEDKRKDSREFSLN